MKTLSQYIKESNEEKTYSISTYIKKINNEFDRLYDKEIVNAKDDLCDRPLDYPVSYDPLHDILTIKPNKKITLTRNKGSIKIWNSKSKKYEMLKEADIDLVKDVFNKVKAL